MQKGIAADKKNHSLFGNWISKTEEIFFFLISAAEKHLGEEGINRILESPDHSGQTVFTCACFLSEKMSGWVLDRNIDVAFVDHKWLTPQFWFKSTVEKMLKKGINPFVVPYTEKSEFVSKQINFENIDQKLLKPFLTGKIIEERTEAFYSFQDSKCNKKCKNWCKDKMLKFKLYTGKRNFENGKRGGEGIVTFGTWHREPAAFKLLELGRIVFIENAEDAISNAEKTRAEFETASKLSHPNIIKVIHLFRYQETEKIGGFRFFQNWTVIVMEKHQKNIGELSDKERIALPILLEDVLGKVIFTIHTKSLSNIKFQKLDTNIFP